MIFDDAPEAAVLALATGVALACGACGEGAEPAPGPPPTAVHDTFIGFDTGGAVDTAFFDTVGPAPEVVACPPWEEVGTLHTTYGPVWAAAPHDVWWLGAGQLWHWDGAAVTRTPTACELHLATDMIGSGGALWVSTSAGTVWQREADGTWVRHVVAAGEVLSAVFALAPDRVWVVGAGGRVATWDGATWTHERVAGADGPSLVATWAASASAIWVVGIESAPGVRRSFVYRRTAAGVWQRQLVVPAALTGIWGEDDETVRVVGVNETVLLPIMLARADGAWKEERMPPVQVSGLRITGTPDGDLWIHGDLDLWLRPRDAPEAWTAITAPDGSYARASYLWPLGGGEAWVGGATALRASGGRLEELAPACCSVEAVTGAGPDDVWLFGERGLAWHWDGARFTYDGTLALGGFDAWPPGTVRGATTAPDGATWVVGSEGRVWRHADGVWQPLPVPDPSATLLGVWADARDRAIVVGLIGDEGWNGTSVLYTWRDGAWAAPAAGPPFGEEDGGLFAIDGAAADDVWAVGIGSHAWHYDGAAWSAVPIGFGARLSDLAVTPSGRVLAVGSPEVFDSTAFGMLLELRADGIRAASPELSDVFVAVWADDARGVVLDATGNVWLEDGREWVKRGLVEWAVLRPRAQLFGDGARVWLAASGMVFRSPVGEAIEALTR